MNIDKFNITMRTANQDDWARIIEIYNQAVLEGGKTADLEIVSVEQRKEWLNQHLSQDIQFYSLNKIHKLSDGVA